MDFSLSPGLLRVARWGVFALLAVGIILGFSHVFQTAWEDIQDRPIAFAWQFVVAWLLFALAVALSGALWGRILGELEGRKLALADAARAHCFAWLLKYIPGQVGSLIYKVTWARQRGYSAANAGLSFLYENLFLQLASLVPSLIILSFFADRLVGDGGDTLLGAVGILAGVGLSIVILGPALRVGMARLGKRYSHGRLLSPLPINAALRHAAWFVLPRIVNAAGFVLVVSAIEPMALSNIAPLGAIYVLAGAIGILAVFVPSGLGVREGVIVVLAAPLVGISTALIAAILARLIATASDILVAAMALCFDATASSPASKEML